jgi:hypothetical protein
LRSDETLSGAVHNAQSLGMPTRFRGG